MRQGAYSADFRHLRARLGRWLRPDPIGFSDGPGLYTYVKNRPTVSTDPTGLLAVVNLFVTASKLVPSADERSAIPAVLQRLARTAVPTLAGNYFDRIAAEFNVTVRRQGVAVFDSGETKDRQQVPTRVTLCLPGGYGDWINISGYSNPRDKNLYLPSSLTNPFNPADQRGFTMLSAPFIRLDFKHLRLREDESILRELKEVFVLSLIAQGVSPEQAVLLADAPREAAGGGH